MFKKVIMNKTLGRLGSGLLWLCIVNNKGPLYVGYLPESCLKYSTIPYIR